MYTIWLSLALSSIAGFIFYKYQPAHPTRSRKLWPFMFALCVLELSQTIGFKTASALMPMQNVDYGPIRLASLRSTDSLNGAFIWGNGSMSSTTKYHFFMLNADGSMTPGAVMADSHVRIVEDAKLKGEGTWTTTKSEKDLSSPVARWCFCTNDRAEIISQNFRVPVGTVMHNFNIQ